MMSEELVNRVRKENYLIDIFASTKDKWYIDRAREIIDFVRKLYRTIEPSHYFGKVIVYVVGSDDDPLDLAGSNSYYDSSMLNHQFNNMIFQLSPDNAVLPTVWTNISDAQVDEIKSSTGNILSYHYNGSEKSEKFIVNANEVPIHNLYSCPSIFALHYHDLKEALSNYSIKRIKNVSCELLKNCYEDENYLYLKNKPEDCMQVSLAEFLKGHMRGVDVNREFTLGASKPVDVRVYWKEANRCALIELKWLGQSLKIDKSIGTDYANGRVNDGMNQIKEYIDLSRGDNPDVITKGYLVVLDSRRKGIKQDVIRTSVSRAEGFHYAGNQLVVKDELQYWKTYPDISEFFRMFVEPKCDL